MATKELGGLDSPLPEAYGGTAATTFNAARTNMGLNPTINGQTAGYTALPADRGVFIHYTGAGGVTLALTAAATLGDGWNVIVRNDAATSITINPNGAELINGAATLTLEVSQAITIFCTGLAFYTEGQPAAVDGANQQLSNLSGTAINTTLVSAADGTLDIGTQANRWAAVYAQKYQSGGSPGNTMTVTGYNSTTTATVDFVTVTSNNPPTAALNGAITTTTQSPLTSNTTVASTKYVDDAVTAGAGAPANATYLVQTASGGLSAEQAMGALTTGLVKNTTTTGVQSIGVNGTDYYGPGTPTPVPVPEGGTGRATSTTAYGTLCAGTTATGIQQTVAPGTTGNVLISAGASALPAYGVAGVLGGGTGRATSTTAYGTICAGTTATGAHQTVAPGTTGNVLISAGASALPAYGVAGVLGGGTGRATGTTAYGLVAVGTTATGAQQTVSPGTSGQALVSAGAAALPAFGTLGVTGGGTGRATSTTAYGTICAGTTPTGAHQTVSPGSAGEVLTSNGASALPTYQAASSGAPVGAQYVTLATDGTLTNERVLTTGPGTGIEQVDAGAGAAITLAVSSVVNAQSGPYTIDATDRGKAIYYTGSGGHTFTLTAAATLGNGFYTFVRNDGNDFITIAPGGSDTINLQPTIDLVPDQGVIIYCNGSLFYTLGQYGRGTNVPYISNRWFLPGNSNNAGYPSFSTFAQTTGDIYYVPFAVGVPTTFDSIGTFIVTGLAASNCNMGVYASRNDNQYPFGAPLVTSGDISTASNLTPVTFSFGSGLRLRIGVYWLAISFSSSIVVPQGYPSINVGGTGISMGATAIDDGSIIQFGGGFSDTFAYSATLPTIAGPLATVLETDYLPSVYLRSA